MKTKTYKTIICDIVKKMKGYEWKVRDTDNNSYVMTGRVQTFDIIGSVIKVWCSVNVKVDNDSKLYDTMLQPLSFDRSWLNINNVEDYAFKVKGYNFVLEDIGNSTLQAI